MNMTRHAVKRIKKRVGKANPHKLFGKALLEGNAHSDFKGSFRRYLDKQGIIHRSNMIIYQGYIFCHKRSTLITVLQIPTKFKNYKAK